MVGRALVMMVPSRADTRPVIMRDAMIAQKRHVRMVGFSSVVMAMGDVPSCAEVPLLLADALTRPDIDPRIVVCTSAGCSS